ncbi:MAG: hypothetical protein KDD32_13865, partial [Bacteroidetes bacterium]|nr:hypothetical protein [Bacteroidota bacterium]
VYRVDSIPVGTNLVITVTNSNGCKATRTFNSPNCPCPEVGVPNGVDEVEVCFGKPMPTLVVFVSPGATADWYTVPVGGTPIAVGTTSFTPSTAGIYYVGERALISGCESAQRLKITVTQVECDDCLTPDCLEIEIQR